jgi:DNA modification methylase
MSVEFYNKDAREKFLEDKSVDLFLVHPPFLYTPIKHYGGDLSLQLHNVKSKKDYYGSMIQSVKNMEQALSDNGNILLLLPNEHNSFNIISEIINNTELIIFKTLFWNYEQESINPLDGKQIVLVLQIRKDHNFSYPIPGLDSLAINLPWHFSEEDLSRYESIGFVHDAFPQGLSDFLIPLFSKEGDTVADIFGGTGTTAVSALKHNRKAIYNDSSSEQFELAKMRVNDIIKETEKDNKMNEQQAITFMVETINETNRLLCEQAGMDKAQIDKQIEQSTASMTMIVTSLYQKMKEANLLA